MKIKLEAVYAGGAYWRVEYADGKIDYVLGLGNIRKIIEDAKDKESIKLETSLGFEEHSKLIELLKSENI